MENQEIKKYLIALGVPKILWNWSIGDTHDAPSDEIKEVGKKIKTTLQEGYSFRIKLRSDIYSAQLAVYLLKCALKEDFIRVGYTNPQSLADMYADSWEGSEAYTEYLARDLVVVDQMVLDNFRDALKVSVFVGFIRNRVFSERSTILVESDNVIFPERFKTMLKNNKKWIDIK